MDEKFQTIIDGLPEKRHRSQLEPYRELVLELHRRGRTFREIASALSEHCGLTVASSTVVRFVGRVKARGRKSKTPDAPMPVVQSAQVESQPPLAAKPTGDYRQRIAELKQRKPKPKPEKPLFDYDPDQPLHLVTKKEPCPKGTS